MPDKRVAVVTGGSSGIGAAIAGKLAAAGLRVFGASRTAGTRSRDDRARHGRRLRRRLGARRCRGILQEAGRIDVLVNNAGYLCAGAVEEVSLADAQAQFQTNYFGVVRMTVEVLPGMRERGSGHIVTLSSLAGLVPVPFWGHYNASKFAVEGLMETLRHEVRPFGIQVALVEPGNIKTRFYARPAPAAMAAYAGARGRCFDAMGVFERKAPGPEIVARKVAAIVDDAHPALHNKITKEATQFTLLRWMLPSGAFEGGVRRGFKLAGKDG